MKIYLERGNLVFTSVYDEWMRRAEVQNARICIW